MGVLALVVFAVELPRLSHYFYTVDSVLFSLAVDRYDVWSLRPHPPGYPVYVFLGGFFARAAGDYNRGFAILSVVFAASSVALLYGFLREWLSGVIAFATALLFSAAPVLRFDGALALTYTAEAAASVGLAWLAWRARERPTLATAAVLGAVLSLATGVRQSVGLFLAPVAAYGLLTPPWDLRTHLRRWGAAVASGLMVTLAWFVPAVALTGGLSRWAQATRFQTREVVFADAVWNRGAVAWDEHAWRLGYFLRAERSHLLPLLLILLLLLGAAAVARRVRPPSPLPRGVPAFLLAWTLPSLAFYLVVFDGWDRGPLGYALVFLPAVYALVGWLASAAWAALPLPDVRALHRWGAVGLAFVLLTPLPALHQDAERLRLDEIVAHDEWARGWDKIRAAYPPNETAILVWYSWAHVKWYFEDYLTWVYFPSYDVRGEDPWILVWQMQHREDERPFTEAYLSGPQGDPPHPIPSTIRTVVVFDFQLAGENGAQRRIDPAVNVSEAWAQDWRLLVFHPDASRPAIEDYLVFER